MRLLAAFSAAILIALPAAARAEKASDAGAVIDKAIKAMGGEENLAKHKTVTWTDKGTFYGAGGDGMAFTGKYAAAWPNRFKMEIEGMFTVAIDGDSAWMEMGGGPQDMDKEHLAEAKENNYASYVATLLPLKDKAYQLTVVDGDKVEGKPTVGVKVSHEGHRDVFLYFDQDSGLLLKSKSSVKDIDQGGKEVTQESTYLDYKDADGGKVPGKIVVKRNGERYVETQRSDYKAAEKLDDKLFKKP